MKNHERSSHAKEKSSTHALEGHLDPATGAQWKRGWVQKERWKNGLGRGSMVGDVYVDMVRYD